MPRYQTAKPFTDGTTFTANQVKTSEWFSLLDRGCNGFLSYQFDTTGSIEVAVQRAIIQDTTDPVAVVATTHATAKGIKDVDMVPARFVRFVCTEKAGAAATLNKLEALFL